MKKIIPILIVALLAVGLLLPAAEPADAIELSVSVTKTADPTSIPEPGDDVEFTVVVTNEGLEDVTIDVLSDTDFDLAAHCPDASGMELASGEAYTCVFTEWIAGNVGDNHENTVTAIATDNAGNSNTVSDDAIVTIDDVQPAISVTKTADPTVVSEPGGDVTFTVVICNDGVVSDPVTIDSLTDSIHGDLSGRGDCSVPQTILPGDCYTCSFTEYVAGNAGDSESDVVIASGTDDEGNPVSDDDDATVTVESLVIAVDVDIKPGSDPNSLNVKSKGVLPVAILGTEDFDVMQVDPPTVLLSWAGMSGGIPGISPLRWNWEDVNGDGFVDMCLKYSMGDLMTYTVTNEPPGPLDMWLMGYLKAEFGGTLIESYDTVRIINKGYDDP